MTTTNKPTHTPEPWHSIGSEIFSEGGVLIAATNTWHSKRGFTKEVNDIVDLIEAQQAAHIVSCVNALTGVPTEDLPGAVENLLIGARSAQYFLKLHNENCPALDEALKPFQTRETKDRGEE